MTHSNPRRNMIPQAVLMRSGIKAVNTVKASACWVWMPKNRVIDHVSKYNNASITLKRFDYIDAQGRFKSDDLEDPSKQGRKNAQIDEDHFEVDDIAAETYVYIRRSATKAERSRR
ncbi:hypothetical protein Tco_0166412 [Tanacetum coccineum]